jgi:replication factor A1
MAADSGSRRQPTFTKVDQLRPGTHGHNLIVKIVDSKMVVQRGREGGPQGRQMRIAECLVGDETGIIVFTARNDQGSPNCFHIPWQYLTPSILQHITVCKCD